MNTWTRLILMSIASLSLAAMESAAADTDTGIPADGAGATAKLGLPRLGVDGVPDSAPRLAPDAVRVNSLDDTLPEPGSGLEKKRVGETDVLAIEVDRAWAQPLWQDGGEVTFASFGLYGSLGTTVTVGGAWLGIVESTIPNCGQLMVGTPLAEGIDWQPLGMHAEWTEYDGRLLASFSTLTVRLDRPRGVWDVYTGMRQKRDQIPLRPWGKVEAGTITVRGGIDGALLTGLVQASQNPLFEDVNDNGINDTFERNSRGALLAGDADLGERQGLAREWRRSDIQRRAPPLILKGLEPDHPVERINRRTAKQEGGEP